MYGNDFGRMAPVKEGQEIDVKIESVGEKGDGIARVDGFVLFVPGTKEGDEIRVRITRVLRRVGFAESIGAAQESVAPEEPAEETLVEQETQEEEVAQEPEPEDSEDFGEELEQ